MGWQIRFEVEPDKLLALTFEPKLEQTLIGRVKRSQFDIGLVMDPHLTEGIVKKSNLRLKDDGKGINTSS